MILRANCKINLGLNVVARREDGYHDLQSVMLPLYDLYDEVEVERCEGESRFVSKGLTVDCEAEQNLCMKALRVMQRRYGVGQVRITLDKRVPFGAGLGGGSSDAVAVVKALDAIFDLALNEEELVEVALALGSDTAFFVRNTPQLCEGRGEVMTPIELPLDGYYIAVAKPDEGVSTREAYGGIVAHAPEVELREALSRPIGEWREVVKNDFEPHIFRAHPAIARLKETMYEAGAVYASMSGSGSAVFGIFESEPRLDVEQDNYLKIIKL